MRFIALIAAFLLVFYALVVFFVGLFDIGFLMLQSAFETPTARQKMLTVLNTDLLHNFALLIVFILVYRVLMRYVERGEVAVALVLEVGIAAALFALLFNTAELGESVRMSYVYVVLGLSLIYAIRFHAQAIVNKFMPPTEPDAPAAPTPVPAEKPTRTPRTRAIAKTASASRGTKSKTTKTATAKRAATRTTS